MARTDIEDNFIILDPKGNTYFGSVATRTATNGVARKIEALYSLDKFTTHPAGQFWCVEVVDGEPITRAAQSRLNSAKKYMKPGRILVWHSLLQNVLDERELHCAIRP